MILGVIADDFTGATDVASMLVRAGMRTVQVIGVPQNEAAPEADAVVVALKSRTTPAAQAVSESLAALRWLRAAGARQFYFKYCSTFDSTPAGNIGPVAEALMDALGSDFAIACPAFPENGRTVFRGHLFVGDQLLSDSGMRTHPLTPMTDADLVRVLQAQSRGRVGLVRHDTVAQGADAVRARFDGLRADGVRLAVADAIDNDGLRVLARACADLPLITAGSGVALGLPAVYAERGWLTPDARAAALPPVGGLSAVVSGSCSSATHAQVAHWLASGQPGFKVDVHALAEGRPVAVQALAFAQQHLSDGPVLVYATSAADEVRAVQAALGVEHAGAMVEECLAQVAASLVDAGVRRLVVAGGETSGAVVQALGVRSLRIGATIDPGVPWTQAEGRPLLLALKSGNFGSVDFFAKALAQVA
ncbi:3-oxo-tetronate kinase [Piscinibacter sp.]|uniref:3-oxo-tetronate kinase n=1 Tax=Piscinibacter sp. TaxID=1903157 RepID=UPI002BD710B0|nr:3-oxo-tetronate kinase [Albitalea sp.]HUG25890.1 3-oxo-tetronate kinase [Albitalea sp.]